MELDNSHITATGDINDNTAHSIVFDSLFPSDDIRLPDDVINLARPF